MNTLKSWSVAGLRVTKIPEQESSNVSARRLFPSWDVDKLRSDKAVCQAAALNCREGSLALSTHSWLVESGGKIILIDAASGNDKNRPDNPKFHLMQSGWMSALRSTGVRPDDVDAVVLTHLHVDHVGWSTVMRDNSWVPAFPRACYYFSARELRFYSEPANVCPPSKGAIEDSIIPVVKAGLGSLIDNLTDEILSGFKIHRTPGHSVDHLSFSFSHGGETALFWGDVLHSPIQVAHPEWNTSFCEFPAEAARSRKSMLRFALETNALVFTSHFPGTSAGRVVAGSTGLSWHSEQEQPL
ncbi:MBL fold metallo-hydrolase [Candidatus Pantoea soli]|uniref:MBL fold metallo-hydrolase n=1 Tax=Candidatus Pantoea soli TaxID=3098669 RepID=A0A518XJH3_9GAMM|nr:MBL fold metallo-hydrolase [Pantoea soli]QDY44341.1 MBL fold metallo-hydrolase [Pantoea soli]